MLHTHGSRGDLGQVGRGDDIRAETGFGHESREQRLLALQKGEGVGTLVETNRISVRLRRGCQGAANEKEEGYDSCSHACLLYSATNSTTRLLSGLPVKRSRPIVIR